MVSKAALKQPHIILINGTSSAGKSTVLKEFKKLCPEYTVLQADHWFPDRLNAKAMACGWQEDSALDPWLYVYNCTQAEGKYVFAHALRKELNNHLPHFYAQALDMLQQGNAIAIDMVFDYAAMYQEFCTYFAGNTIIKVLVYCPAQTLLERVDVRNALGIPAQRRTAFQSFEQFPAFFALEKENTQKQIIDLVHPPTLAKALDDAIQNLIDENIPSSYVPKLRQFQDYFINYFSLDNNNPLPRYLIAKNDYDLIVQSGSNAAHALASQLADFVMRK